MTKLRICFMGTPEFSATVLEGLIANPDYEVVLCVSQPDKPVGRKKIITPPPAKVVAMNSGIEMYQPDSMRTDEAFDTIKNCNPDLIVTAAYGKILPQRVLDIPKYGCLNVHASLLPKYRGAAPIQYSIINGDEKTGVTIMKMDAGMDTGDIIVQDDIVIEPNITTVGLTEQLAVIGRDLLLDMMPKWVSGELKSIKQNEEDVTLSPPIRNDQGEFTWDMSAIEIHNLVRALEAWPGASTIMDGNKLKIYETRVVDFDASTIDFEPVPGQIVKAKKGDLIVKCKEGYIAILSLQQTGGKRLNAIDCAHNYKVGKILGV